MAIPKFESSYYKDFAEYVLNHLRNRDHVLVKGGRTYGKTTVLNNVYKVSTEYFDKHLYFNGYILNGRNNLDLLIPDLGNSKRALLVIDDLDEIQDQNIIAQLHRYVKEWKKYGLSILMSTGEEKSKYGFEGNMRIVQLPLMPRREAQDFILSAIGGRPFDGWDITEYLKLLDKFPLTPRNLDRLIQLSLSGVTPEQAIIQITADLNYINPIILQDSTLILPEQQSIITNARVLQVRLIERINGDFEAIYRMDPRDFEHLVAELYEIEGYDVKVTQQTRDGGKDMIVSKQGITGKHLYYVECKRYSRENKVSVDIVDRLYGNIMADKVSGGIVVTSSSFTQPARTWSEQMQYQMSLIDHQDLATLIKNATSKNRFEI